MGARCHVAMHLGLASRPHTGGELTTRSDIARAAQYADAREGRVGFAVLDQRGRLRGLHRTSSFYAADLVEAMLMVALLRRTGDAPLSAADRALLVPMMADEDTPATIAAFDRVGREGLLLVARTAGMKGFSVVDHVLDAVITPADQARFLLHLDGLVPRRHREEARSLLTSGGQHDIAAVAGGAHVVARSAARSRMVHEVAVLQRDGYRVALAVLTSGQPSEDYGRETVRGIAARLLIPTRDSTAGRARPVPAHSPRARR